jgi:hypothetical protein
MTKLINQVDEEARAIELLAVATRARLQSKRVDVPDPYRPPPRRPPAQPVTDLAAIAAELKLKDEQPVYPAMGQTQPEDQT